MKYTYDVKEGTVPSTLRKKLNKCDSISQITELLKPMYKKVKVAVMDGQSRYWKEACVYLEKGDQRIMFYISKSV